MILLTYKQVKAYTIGTTRKDFETNPKRIGLLIQNLSGTTVYFLQKGSENTDFSIEIDGTPYSDEIGASSGFSLKASANSDVRIEEIFKV